MNDPKEFAEKVAFLHFAVATSENVDIAYYRNAVYKASLELLKATIRLAYPEVDTERIYETWVDCNESIAYCANWVRNNLDY